MDNENNIRCKEIANVAFGQLFWSIDKWTYFSWRVMKKAYLMYKNMPSLALRCSALIHKGWVYISLDESTDTYVITLLNTAKEVVRTREDVYCDCLGEIIDGMIEKPVELTEEKYKELAIQDSLNKL